MIGGIDVYIPTSAGNSSVEIAVRAIRQIWPNAVFENGLTGDRYNHFGEIPFGDIEELFVYRSTAAADIWDSAGAVPDVYNTMVHLIAEKEMIIVVVDEKDAAMERILTAIRSALNDDIVIDQSQDPAERAHNRLGSGLVSDVRMNPESDGAW